MFGSCYGFRAWSAAATRMDLLPFLSETVIGGPAVELRGKSAGLRMPRVTS